MITESDIEQLRAAIYDTRWNPEAMKKLSFIVDKVEDWQNVNDANEKEFEALTSVIGRQALLIEKLRAEKIEKVTDAEIYNEDIRRMRIEERTFCSGAKWMRERFLK